MEKQDPILLLTIAVLSKHLMWFVFVQKIEQIDQIVSQGMQRIIIDKLIPYCLSNSCSETSAKVFLEAFGSESKKTHLAMAILEASLIVNVGILFCRACYQLEGNSPLILTAHRVFENYPLNSTI